MTLRRPVVNISGDRSELPPGDSVVNGVAGTFTAGSGLQIVGDGNLANDIEVDVNIAPNPSGLIFVDNEFLALDGRAQITGDHALASGNYALETATVALASGVAARENADAALASGFAALTDINKIRQGTVVKYTTGSPVISGYPVGFDDAGAVNPVITELAPFGGALSGVTGDFDGWINNASYQTQLGAFSDTEYVWAGEYATTNDIYATPVFYDPDTGIVTSGTAVRIAPLGTAQYVHTHVYDKENKKFAVNWIEAATRIRTVLAQVSGDTVVSGGDYEIAYRAASLVYLQSAYSPTLSGFGYTYYHNVSAQRHYYYSTAVLSGNIGGPVTEDAVVSGGQIELDIDRANWNVTATITDQGNNNCFFSHTQMTSAPFTRFLNYLSISGESHRPVFIASGTSNFGNAINPNLKGSTYHPVTNKTYTFYASTNQPIYVESTSLSGTTVTNTSGVLIPSGIQAGSYYMRVGLDEHNNQTNIISYANQTSPNDPYFHIAFVPSGDTFTTSEPVCLFVGLTSTNNYPNFAQNSGSSSFPIFYGPNTNQETNSLTYTTQFYPLKDGKLSYIGVAQTEAAASGDIVEVRLPGSYDKANNESFAPGTQVYVASGGFTSSITQPVSSGIEGWKSVGRVIDSSTILLTDMLP